ncbi:hypothetical protein HTZ84_17820 [Haloterrigena sp. SYSU A558-1]|uniref:Uncharacterized protein n=2 Tax=Haloterrigena gelatinilytica TaxID=2741724 RepID=A0A8J8GKJ0_9EURY|nr:hypothetical protein [Haloterrigena gelatinilytica]NUC74136.1 hypothetical protein [Haloterrigena gelatinilytica]
MGGELRIRVDEERMPPPVEGHDAEDDVWRLSLEHHRDLLLDITGVDPTGELTLRELETIRARLEGYVEREKRASAGIADSTAREERARGPSPLRRLVGRLLDVIPSVGTRLRGSKASERPAGSQRSYSVSRVQRLAEVFRIAIDARRAEIPSASVDPLTDATARTGSSADVAAD